MKPNLLSTQWMIYSDVGIISVSVLNDGGIVGIDKTRNDVFLCTKDDLPYRSKWYNITTIKSGLNNFFMFFE